MYKNVFGGGTFLVDQWLRLQTSNAGGTSSIPGEGTKIPHATWCVQKQIIKNHVFWVFLAHPVVNSFTLVNGYVDNSVMHVEKCLEMQVKKDVPMSVTWGKKEKKKHLLFYQLSDIPSHHLLLLSSSPFFCAMHLVGSLFPDQGLNFGHGSWSPNHWTARERPQLRRNTLNMCIIPYLSLSTALVISHMFVWYVFTFI